MSDATLVWEQLFECERLGAIPTGPHVKYVRERLGLTRVELSRILGMHPSTIYKVETGRTKLNAWQSSMMYVFTRAAYRHGASAGGTVRAWIDSRGVVVALYYLLGVGL